MSSASKAVFLDRDGVINQRPPEGLYITSTEELHLLPGVVDAIARLKHAGYRVFIVTNQRCIARGIASADVVAQIHDWLLQLLAVGHAAIDRIFVCPHDDADVCSCRKPKPGMLLQAACDFDLDLSECWMVGDSRSDIEAGRAAGCWTFFIGAGDCSEADGKASSLADAVDKILAVPHPA